jgi:hypothetical protein
MVRPRLALLGAALELDAGLRADDVASSGFTSGPHPITSTASSSGSSGSGASTSSSGSTSGEDSGSGAVSASGTTTGNMSTLDMGLIPDFGGQPIGCQGKIDFLFVISSWYSMKGHQVQLQEAFPAFTAMLEDEFADFDYHIMVVEAGGNALLNTCDACYDCTGCMKPGCAEYGGPEDYPCKGPFVVCDVTERRGGDDHRQLRRDEQALRPVRRQPLHRQGRARSRGDVQVHRHRRRGPQDAVPMTMMQAALDARHVERRLQRRLSPQGRAPRGRRPQRGAGQPHPGDAAGLVRRVVAAKGGNEEAIVTLVLSNDLDLPNPKCPGPILGPNPLRLFAEAAAHGRFESICVPSYVGYLKTMAATIIEQCSLLIPG